MDTQSSICGSVTGRAFALVAISLAAEVWVVSTVDLGAQVQVFITATTAKVRFLYRRLLVCAY